MEDERIVPVLVSVYKAEVWRHFGFCGNVRTGTVARALAAPRVKSLQLSLVSGALCGVGAVLASRSQGDHPSRILRDSPEIGSFVPRPAFQLCILYYLFFIPEIEIPK